MKKNYLNVPYFVISFEQHQLLKQDLQNYIDQAEFQSVNDITKTDFYLKKTQKYKEFVTPYILDSLGKIFGKSNIKVLDCWFQEYTKYSFHPFHSHDCEWALVYYINLPKGSRGTIFKDYISNDEIEPTVREGDIIVFPGWIKHKSPTNKGDLTKTIISYNFEVVA